jgi:hypothetical protein
MPATTMTATVSTRLTVTTCDLFLGAIVLLLVEGLMKDVPPRIL